MLLTPLAQWHGGRLLHEGDRLTLTGSGDGRPLLVVQRIPETFRFPVEDQKDIFVNIAADSELVSLFAVFSSVDHEQIGERSPAYGHRLAADLVVDQFVMIEKRRRVSSDIIVVGIADHHDLVILFRTLVGTVTTRR